MLCIDLQQIAYGSLNPLLVSRDVPQALLRFRLCLLQLNLLFRKFAELRLRSYLHLHKRVQRL